MTARDTQPRSSTGHVRVDDHGAVSVITLDDGKANALTTAVLDDLAGALADAAGRAEAVVLTGRPGYLSAGLDREIMLSGDADAAAELLRAAGRFFRGVLSLPAPLVVASPGHALAGGAVLLLCADRRLGAAGPGQIGLTELAVGVELPPLATALARARLSPNELWAATLGAGVYEPAAAVAAGYLDELHPPAKLLVRAVERADQLTAVAAGPYLATRERLLRPILAEAAAR